MDEIDKIFESIGYTVKKVNNGYVRYKKHEYYGEEISFDLAKKKVRKVSRGSGNPCPVYITADEVKAIEQFYKVKGWL